MTIGGDVNTANVVKLVQRYFGAIPRGPEVSTCEIRSGVLDKDRYVSYVRVILQDPPMRLVFPRSLIIMLMAIAEKKLVDLLAQVFLGGGGGGGGRGRSAWWWGAETVIPFLTRRSSNHKSIAGKCKQPSYQNWPVNSL